VVIAVLPVQQLNPVTQGAFAVVLVDAHGFARDLMVQEVGFAKLQALGVKVVAAESALIPGRHTNVKTDQADTRRSL
jgi:hypothetical protein